MCYRDPATIDQVCKDDLDVICQNIHDKLIAAVEKRLVSDAKVGFLLSGGLILLLYVRLQQNVSFTTNPHLCHRDE